MMTHIADLSSPSNTQRFTCNGAKVTYNASLIWGTVGPQRMFQSGQVYSWIKWMNVPIFFNAAGEHSRSCLISGCAGGRFPGGSGITVRFSFPVPPVNPTQITSTSTQPKQLKLQIEQVLTIQSEPPLSRNGHRHRTRTGNNTIIIFFALSYHHVVLFNWWGNTDDANSVPWLKVSPEELASFAN